MQKNIVYFDNSATTKVEKDVLTVMNQYHEKEYGNPSSLHRMGINAEKAIKETRERIGNFLKVTEQTIFFLSGGTEGNNIAIFSSIEKNKHIGKKIVTSKIEHPSVLEVFKYLQTQGYEVTYLDVDCQGLVDIKHLEGVIDNQTSFVSIMKVNNEIGTVQPLKEISSIVKSISPQCIVHSDCVQAFGKIPLHPIDEGIDIITFSAHKFHGPKGVGGMYLNSTLKIKPLIFGGGQEKGLRSGTENVPGIIGMGKAIELFERDFKSYMDFLYNLKVYTMDSLSKNIEGMTFNSDKLGFAPHILNISIENIKGEVLQHMLEDKGVYVSTGSACSSRKKTQSHVLKSIGLDKKSIDGSLRISFSKFNTFEDIDLMVQALKESVTYLNKYIRR
ncbi:MAG: cysteine desulfurase family protein [Eubacteriaceae bacterium]